MEQANEYMKKYVIFKQKEKNMKKENKHGRKISIQEFEDKASEKRKNLMIGKKGRIYTEKVEYEVFSKGKVVQLAKGTKVKLLTMLNGKKYVYVNKQRYEIKVSIEVEKEEYRKIEMKEKSVKVKEDMTVRFEGKDYVILQNNGKHVELEEYTKVLYQEKEGQKRVYHNGLAYAVVEKEEYAFKRQIRARKICGVKFHCQVRYEGNDYILVDRNKKIAYQPDEVNKLLIKYHIDGLYAWKDDTKVCELELSSTCKKPIPNSLLQAKRYRNNQ